MRRAAAAALVALAALMAGCANELQQYREDCWQAGGYVLESPEKIVCLTKRPGRS